MSNTVFAAEPLSRLGKGLFLVQQPAEKVGHCRWRVKDGQMPVRKGLPRKLAAHPLRPDPGFGVLSGLF